METKHKNEEQFFANELKMSYHLLSPKDQKPSRIYMLVRLNGKQHKIMLGAKVYPLQWNAKVQKAYISDILTLMDNHNNTIVNNRIRECNMLFLEFKDYLCETNIRKNSIDVLKKLIYKDMPKRNIVKKNPLLWLKIEVEKKYSERKTTSLNIFISNLNDIEGYCKDKEIQLNSLQDIDYEFLVNYRSWKCGKESKKYEGLLTDISSVNHTITNIKTMLKLADELGEYDRTKSKIDNLKSIPQKLKSYEDMIALTEEEIASLNNLELTNIKEIKTRDVFLFSCYVGQRCSDIKKFYETAQLINEDGKQYFRLRQKKTQKIVIIPILPEAKVILDRNEWRIGYPLQNENLINLMIKELCKRVGINKEEITYHEDKNGIHEIKKERWQIVATHTARRTFVTIAYKRNIDIETIAKITGHDLKMVQMYLRVTQGENANMFLEGWNKEDEVKTEQKEKTKEVDNKELIDEAKRVLAFLGCDAITIADITNIDEANRLIYVEYEKQLTEKGIDYRIIKNLYNKNTTTLREKKEALDKIVKEIDCNKRKSK